MNWRAARRTRTASRATDAAVVDLVGRVRAAYRAAKDGRAALDFDDLESLTRDLLRDDGVRARYLGAEFRHVLVDEFQDTNAAQWAIIQRIADPALPGCLFVVGDPKQSIYGFRGADVQRVRAGARRDRGVQRPGRTGDFVSHPSAAGRLSERPVRAAAGARSVQPGQRLSRSSSAAAMQAHRDRMPLGRARVGTAAARHRASSERCRTRSRRRGAGKRARLPGASGRSSRTSGGSIYDKRAAGHAPDGLRRRGAAVSGDDPRHALRGGAQS